MMGLPSFGWGYGQRAVVATVSARDLGGGGRDRAEDRKYIFDGERDKRLVKATRHSREREEERDGVIDQQHRR